MTYWTLAMNFQDTIKKTNTIESILNQAIIELNGLDDENKDKIIEK